MHFCLFLSHNRSTLRSKCGGKMCEENCCQRMSVSPEPARIRTPDPLILKSSVLSLDASQNVLCFLYSLVSTSLLQSFYSIMMDEINNLFSIPEQILDINPTSCQKLRSFFPPAKVLDLHEVGSIISVSFPLYT